MIIYAVIRSTLLYGLQTVQLAEAVAKKFDALQMSGLRQTMNTTHLLSISEHIPTNTYWKRQMTKLIYTERTQNRTKQKIQLFKDNCEERHMKLPGHVIRTNNEDPLRQGTLKHNTA